LEEIFVYKVKEEKAVWRSETIWIEPDILCTVRDWRHLAQDRVQWQTVL